MELENIMLWDKMLREIYDTYLNGSESKFEANVPKPYCDNIKQLINEESLSITMWEGIENVVTVNLMDTLSRFRKTKKYKELYNNLYLNSQLKDALLN